MYNICWGEKLVLFFIICCYLHTTFNFHMVSKYKPLTFGFSARHVIDLPSSSVVGTKLNSERVVLLEMSSCNGNNMKREIKQLFVKKELF